MTLYNRRSFLQVAAAAAAALVLDPERALWVPGRKTIFVLPPAPPLRLPMRALDCGFRKGDIITIDGRRNPYTGELQRFVVTDVDNIIPEPDPDQGGSIVLRERVGVILLSPDLGPVPNLGLVPELIEPPVPTEPETAGAEYWYKPQYRHPATEVARRRAREDEYWRHRRRG
jgi:hypothetical protein